MDRQAIVVYADGSLYSLGTTAADAVVFIRTDQDLAEGQLPSARTLATKIGETARQTTSSESEQTLQSAVRYARRA